jgi:hypothetical protein
MSSSFGISSRGSGGSRNLQLGIHFANMVFILSKLMFFFAKIIAILPWFAKIFGIHMNTKEDPWRRHCLEVSCFQGVSIWTIDDGTCGFNDEYMLSWKHKISDEAMLTHTNVVSLLKAVGRSSALVMKIQDQPMIGLVIIGAHAVFPS